MPRTVNKKNFGSIFKADTSRLLSSGISRLTSEPIRFSLRVMSKFQRHVVRKDLKPDHVHKMPEGQISDGMLGKPNANARAGWHTHMFEDEGRMFETLPAYDDGDHVHEFRDEFTSGPMPMPKNRGEEMGRLDSIQREGSQWVVRSTTGHEIARGATKLDALEGIPKEDRKRLIAAS